ncbi:MAG: hemolysin D [Gammaproteobacteria bacterium]|nr:MAG: hemolysin D [Gammaproteobacteria bacterium]RLA35566.1 MAG: hemolysin D [Gammaproteobacteria bacterium]
MEIDGAKFYSPLEERINVLSHALGFILSIFALALLVVYANRYGSLLHVLSFGVFGVSLVILYAASTLYHSTTNPARRVRFRILDHAAIYILISGTYTPIMLVILSGWLGWLMFGITWGLAAIGIVLKLFFTGKYSHASTAMYVFMGWLIVFAIKPLINNFSADGLWWLLAGGLAYTVGAVIYSFKKIKFHHAIFHVFVLAGSACHFVMVYFYVLPAA